MALPGAALRRLGEASRDLSHDIYVDKNMEAPHLYRRVSTRSR